MKDVNPIFLDSRLRGSDGKTELVDGLAKAGIQRVDMKIFRLDSGLRRNDVIGANLSTDRCQIHMGTRQGRTHLVSYVCPRFSLVVHFVQDYRHETPSLYSIHHSFFER